jgi:DNA-binding NtrC family response regulator
MTKVGLFSTDRTLYPVLSSALGKDFQLMHEFGEERMGILAESGSYDVLLLDLHGNPDSLQERIESCRRLLVLEVPAVIMADEDTYAAAYEFINREAFGYCRRPPSIRELKNLLQRACESSSPDVQLQADAQELEPVSYGDWIIGASTQMNRVAQLVRRVAGLNVPVSITGESGTGKELIARAIHNLGPRSTHPFVAVSCGAIPENLIESELFGYASGAFTGANSPHEGYFEKAAEGTLFFDEIGEISLTTQVKLLRVLQEREFSRLGSTRIIPLRARVMFATNRNLPKMIAEGRFRRDLFYRINVMNIQSPPLVDHLEDIPLLANHFLRRYSRLFGKPLDGIEAKAIDVLKEHSWPGNVRELENVIQRAIVEASGRLVRARDIYLTAEEDCTSEDDKVLDIGDYLPNSTFEKQIRDYKVKLALAAVRENNGNKALAARSLGMSRGYLYRLISLAGSESCADQSAPCSMKA